MNSKSGDPLFVNPSEGDFRVKDQSDALKIGFVNFSMDQFGVLDQSLKEKAKKPVLPRQLYTEMVANKEMFVEWIGATIKKLSGLGERSATGMDADPEMINEVLDVMVELAQEGMTMMCVTHEMGFARKVAHRVIFMDRGEIVEDAPKAEFFGTPRSERAQQFLSKILHH